MKLLALKGMQISTAEINHEAQFKHCFRIEIVWHRMAGGGFADWHNT
jgi:hypothetical protein